MRSAALAIDREKSRIDGQRTTSAGIYFKAKGESHKHGIVVFVSHKRVEISEAPRVEKIPNNLPGTTTEKIPWTIIIK